MRGHFLTLTLCALLTAVGTDAQPAASLTGTVIVVNQQSDTVTLVDLKAMEAYRHVRPDDLG